jgi:hypothetical protein
MKATPNASDMAFKKHEKADGQDLAKCWLQEAPAKQLVHLTKIPIAGVHGEASFYAPYAHCLIKYMAQAGLYPTLLNLGAMGIHGNGHMMMVSKALSEKAAAPAWR